MDHLEELCELKVKIGRLEQKIEDSALALQVAQVASRAWAASAVAIILALLAMAFSFFFNH